MLLFYTHTFCFISGPGSSVGLATDYWLDGPGSNPGGDEIIRQSRPALVERTRNLVAHGDAREGK